MMQRSWRCADLLARQPTPCYPSTVNKWSISSEEIASVEHVVCFSGGHSSALVAIEVVRRYGREGVVLLNHDISAAVEDADIKRFKCEVADYIGIPITYASFCDQSGKIPDQFDVCVAEKAFKTGHDKVLCTDRLKTRPFGEWLESFALRGAVIYYGFDASETERIRRRSTHLAAKGYRTAFPLAHWPRTISTTEEIGVRPPLTYGVWKHANCVGCIKAGKQHWYAVFVHRRDVWEKAKWAEEEIGYSIQPDVYLSDLEPTFAEMVEAGVEATEKISHQHFWVDARRLVRSHARSKVVECASSDENQKPCECVI